MAISKEIALLKDFQAKAERNRASYGRTELFSTSLPALDRYLFGGYGRPGNYEIVLLFGSTKIGKSTIGLNLLRSPILSGKRVGILALEDDGADIYLKLEEILGPAGMKRVTEGDSVHIVPESALQKMWRLDELLEMIEEWFVHPMRNLDVILLDHLQFAFENAESIKGENEWAQQRVFMRNLNILMRRLGKTIILVSHVNKSTNAKGLTRIVGSSGIAAAATKNLEVYKDDEGRMFIQEHGSRFTPTPEFPLEIQLRKSRIELPFTPVGGLYAKTDDSTTAGTVSPTKITPF